MIHLTSKSKRTLIFFLIILSAIILSQNTALVSIQFLFWTMTMSRIVLIFLLLFLGAVLGYLIAKNRML